MSLLLVKLLNRIKEDDMEKHKIDLSAFKNYKFSHSIASCIGCGENKILSVVVVGLDAHYEVVSNEVVISETNNLRDAIAAYNEA